MIYEVKKDGRGYMRTTDKRAVYPAAVERSIQAAGYDIYIDGRKKPYRKKEGK